MVSAQYPQLLTYGCSAHYMNLAEKEAGTNAIVKHIIKDQKHFRNVHQARGWLEEKGGLVPQLPNDTRWNSHLACIKMFVSNYPKYVQIFSEQDCSSQITKVLDNVGILREANNLLKQLTFIGTSLDKLQSDSTFLADAVEIWQDVVECEDLEHYKDEFLRCSQQALEPFHYLANLMHPKYMGRRLDASQVSSKVLLLQHAVLPPQCDICLLSPDFVMQKYCF